MCAIIVNGRKMVAGKRADNKVQGGLWEFPGGKLFVNQLPEMGIVCKIEQGLKVRIQLVGRL